MAEGKKEQAAKLENLTDSQRLDILKEQREAILEDMRAEGELDDELSEERVEEEGESELNRELEEVDSLISKYSNKK